MEFELILKIGGKDATASSVSLGKVCGRQVCDEALLGLQLAEAKQVLARLQTEIVTTQARVRIPANVTADSGNVTGIPVNVTKGRCCAVGF